MKKQKGITLIALIITIIVLLILAGVSISIIVGDNGVIKQAQTAKDKTDLANAKTAIETAVATLQTEYMAEKTTNANKDIADVFTYKKLNEELGKLNYQLANGENGTESIFDSGEEGNKKNTSGAQFITQIKSKKIGEKDLYNLVLLKKNKSSVVVGDNLKLANSQVSSKSLNIGDAYPYSVRVNGVTISNWRVFFADEEGTYIITTDYLPVTALGSGENSIKDKTGLTTVGEYNAYWSNLNETKNQILNVFNVFSNNNFLTNYHSFVLNASNSNSRATSTLLNTENWS